MKTLNQWLDEYSASHRNPRNKLTHWIGIPLIVFAIWCALKAIPVGTLWLNAATLSIAVFVGYYLLLSWRLALGMALVSALLYAGVLSLERSLGPDLVWAAAGIFVFGWVLQFIGHHIEGAKPSFFKDLQFLLIGPLWLLADVYRRLDIPMLSRRAAQA
ncbi:MAG: DUF962 domain-containing protein [Stagnimonas sp.]|nr:DUF962 domain-containing protein [Stagnimonas sp.]